MMKLTEVIEAVIARAVAILSSFIRCVFNVHLCRELAEHIYHTRVRIHCSARALCLYMRADVFRFATRHVRRRYRGL
jgi:hypothetical protein